MENVEMLRKYNSVYLTIIARYKDYIDESEGLYIAELPKLVTPKDESVTLISNNIKGNFISYSHESNFHEAAMHAYRYVKELTTVSMPVQFWQTPKETISNEAGDLFDKAVLLCSILIALGEPSSKVLVIIKNDNRDFMVYYESNGSITAMDLENKVTYYKSSEELISSIGIKENSDMDAYEFNDKMYLTIE